ncbi:MAG: hypothetical protein QM820_08070 [Minicystis sp.]
MAWIRMMVGLLIVGALPLACSSGASGSCNSQCDKQETCGDIDSVKADQCRAKCDANADVAEATLDACINKSDILSATSECLARACSDYAQCLTTIPACKHGGSTGSGTVNPGSVACESSGGGPHVCYELNTMIACPSGTTPVTACSQANLLGSCSIGSGGASLTEYFYTDGPLSSDTAQQTCQQSGGTWTPAGSPV